MHLNERESERLLVHLAGSVARARKDRGVKLNVPEAIALITAELYERARDGHTVAQLMSEGRDILSTEDVMEGVAEIVTEIQFEATFPDGTKLVTLHEPIGPALGVGPGSMIFDGDDLTLNEGRDTAQVHVTNTADRPVQVGSHYHFFEVNKALEFNRALAFGMRLDIPSGTCVRFEPGETKKVSLVSIGGARNAYGLNGLVEGSLDDPDIKAAALDSARRQGFLGA